MLNKGVIIVGFPENGHLGCEKHCNFCPFFQADYNIEVKPSDEDVLNFIEQELAPKAIVQICGAGDPLFNFKKNKNYLVHLIQLIKSKNHNVQLVTKYTEVVLQYWDSELKDIDGYVFSVETLDSNIRDLCSLLLDNEKYVRLSKLYYIDSKMTINRDFIKQYIDFYNQVQNVSKLMISFRPNFAYPIDDDTLSVERKWLISLKNKNTSYCHFYLHENKITTVQLWGNKQLPCSETFHKIQDDMNIDLEK